MNIDIPPDLQSFVDEEFATGRYSTKQDVLVQALRGLKRERTEAIAGVNAGIDDLAAGRIQPIREAFDDLKREFGVIDK
jgi:putative addiction module CopG family antidote